MHLLHLGPTHCYGGYYINGSVITPTESVKDLGIIIDPFLKFHIACIHTMQHSNC